MDNDSQLILVINFSVCHSDKESAINLNLAPLRKINGFACTNIKDVIILDNSETAMGGLP